MRLIVKGAAKSASFIAQYRQSILHILFSGESTPLSINIFLEPSNHSLKRICYEISRGSRQEGLEIFWGQKDVSSLVDDPPAGNLKIRHDQSDLERSDKDSFKELFGDVKSALILKGVLSPMNSVFRLNCRYDIEMNEADLGAPLTIALTWAVSFEAHLLCRLQIC